MVSLTDFLIPLAANLVAGAISAVLFLSIDAINFNRLHRLESAIYEALPDDEARDRFVRDLYRSDEFSIKTSKGKPETPRTRTNPAPSTTKGNRALRCFYSPKIQRGQVCLVKLEFPLNEHQNVTLSNQTIREKLLTCPFVWENLDFAYVVNEKVYLIYGMTSRHIPRLPLKGDVQKCVSAFSNLVRFDNRATLVTVVGVKAHESEYVYRLIEDEAKRSRAEKIRTLYTNTPGSEDVGKNDSPLTLTKMYKFLEEKIVDLKQTLDDADGVLLLGKENVVSIHRPKAEELAQTVEDL